MKDIGYPDEGYSRISEMITWFVNAESVVTRILVYFGAIGFLEGHIAHLLAIVLGTVSLI